MKLTEAIDEKQRQEFEAEQRRKTILKTAWICCPECHKTWNSTPFTKLYEAQAKQFCKDKGLNLSDKEIERMAERVMKEQGQPRTHTTALIEIPDKGVYMCPHCKQLYTYETICNLLKKPSNRIVIAISKLLVFIIKPFKK